MFCIFLNPLSFKKNFALLQKVIINDIIGSIKANQQVGNITEDDANQLQELTLQLYDHIYSHYEEFGGHDNMKPLLEGAMELPLDKYRIQIDELEHEMDTLEQKSAALEQKNTELEEEISKLKALLKDKDNK